MFSLKQWTLVGDSVSNVHVVLGKGRIGILMSGLGTGLALPHDIMMRVIIGLGTTLRHHDARGDQQDKHLST